MAGDLGEKEGGRRLEDSLNASPADAELLTRLVPCQYFLFLTENWVISAQTTPLQLKIFTRPSLWPAGQIC